MVIGSKAEYDAALGEIQTLAGCLEGTPEEHRLEALVDAAHAWEQSAQEK